MNSKRYSNDLKIFFLVLLIMNSSGLCDIENSFRYVGIFPRVEGLNCWNFALYTFGLSNSLRNVDEGEFSAIIESPLCKKLHNDETDFSKTIGVVREIDDFKNTVSEVHAFVFVNNKNIISKNGSSTRSAYISDTLEKLMAVDLYSVIPECQFNTFDVSLVKPNRCKRFLEKYRCTALSDYLNRAGWRDLKVSVEIFRIFSILVEFEKQLQAESLFLVPLKLAAAESAIFSLKKAIAALKYQKKISKKEYAIIKILAAQLNGISGQLYYQHASPLMDYFSDFSTELTRLVRNGPLD